MKKKKKADPKQTVFDYHQLVCLTAARGSSAMVQELNGLPDKVRFTILSRAVLCLFQEHFRMAATTAAEALASHMKAQK